MANVLKCCYCKTNRYKSYYDYEKDGITLYKTCQICRNKIKDKKNSTTISPEPIPEPIPETIPEPIEEPIPERIQENRFRILKESDDSSITIELWKTAHQLKDLLSNRGYKPIKFDDYIYSEIFENGYNKDEILLKMINNNLALILFSGINKMIDKLFVLLPLEENNVSLLEVNDMSVLESFIRTVKQTNKKRCDICSEKNTRIFKKCSCCNNCLC